MNTTSLIARLTADPELKELFDDKQVCRMRVAYNRPGGEDRGAAYFDVEVWGQQAKTCAEYLSKGRQVAITGYLEHDQWKADDGSNRQKVHIVARSVDFLGAPKGSDEPDVARDQEGNEIPF